MSDRVTQIAGHVDICTWEVMRGWVRRPDRPDDRVVLELMVDGEVVAQSRADVFGRDLLDAGVGDGCFRFSFELGSIEQLRTGDIHDVQVRDSEHHTSLPHVRLSRWTEGSLDGAPLVEVLAARYLLGTGLEIGALNRPQKLTTGAQVHHVDLLSTPDLRLRYPEVPPASIVDVEIVDDGATLATVRDQSADFLIANNVLEHVEDPIATLANWHRVVRVGGIVLLVVPNPRASADVARSPTSVEHVLADHRDGGVASRTEHYREWVRDVEHRPANEFDARASQLEAINYPVHFHVWNEIGCALLVHAMVETTGRRFLVEHLALTADRRETILVLRAE
jgi:SAM-dependent methyltransferase